MKNALPLWGLALCCLLMSSKETWATHIVGGEITLRHLRENSFELQLTLYFDDINGNPNAKDNEAPIGLYSKRNNDFIASYTLPLRVDSLITPQSASCTTANYRTRLLRYSNVISLPVNTLSDALGYYLSYSRCCRNGVISNIELPGLAGTTLYTEIPPFPNFSNAQGAPVYEANSTPFPRVPFASFACIDRWFELDFSAFDIDGDSLSYSFATPLQGDADQFDPAPGPLRGPYRPVIFTQSLTADSAIPANIKFNINPKTGLLRLRASRQGLYVFSVRTNEYKNGVLQGFVQRDYQLVVRDCPPVQPPKASFTFPDRQGDRLVIRNQFDTLTIRATENTACAILNIFGFLPQEEVSVVENPINYENINLFTFNPSKGTIRAEGDSLKIRICGPLCTNDSSFYYLTRLRFRVNSCTGVLEDTALLAVRIIPFPPINDLRINIQNNNEPISVRQGVRVAIQASSNRTTFPIELITQYDTSDANTARLAKLFPNPSDAGLNLRSTQRRNLVQDTLQWNINCDIYNVLRGNTYRFRVVARTIGRCNEAVDDTSFTSLTIPDFGTDTDFQPGNYLTPTFSSNNEFSLNNLPQPPCFGEFRNLKMFNRFGSLIYETENPSFKWDATGNPDGLYYYIISFEDGFYKGWVQVARF